MIRTNKSIGSIAPRDTMPNCETNQIHHAKIRHLIKKKNTLQKNEKSKKGWNYASIVQYNTTECSKQFQVHCWNGSIPSECRNDCYSSTPVFGCISVSTAKTVHFVHDIWT